MDKNEIFCIDSLNMHILQKIEVDSLLQWPNLIFHPSKHGDKHGNSFDIF